MAMKKSNIACVHRRNISRYDSGERCGPWASCFSLLTGIHLIFGTLLCHTKMQIKIEFGFDLLIFPEVMALDLEKYDKLGRKIKYCLFAVAD
jgi:hypothetical protein